MWGCTRIYSIPECTTSGEFAWLPVDYFNIIHSPSSFFLFPWLSAVRVHTHPWAKESKIDHTSNWSRCTGSSSRAHLSHAGKIMHPKLTAQHTRLPSTSFLKCSRSLTIGRIQGRKYCHHCDLPMNDCWMWDWLSAASVRTLWLSIFGSNNCGSFILSCGLLAMA